MIFDTDIIIWVQKGNKAAARLIDDTEERYVSLLTNLELLQGAQTKKQIEITKSFLYDFNFQILPITENIGHRALIYLEEYALSHGLRAMDAMIAATAVENNLILCSSNRKHYKAIKDLKFRIFKP